MVGVFLFSIFPNPLLMPLLVTMGIKYCRLESRHYCMGRQHGHVHGNSSSGTLRTGLNIKIIRGV